MPGNNDIAESDDKHSCNIRQALLEEEEEDANKTTKCLKKLQYYMVPI